MAAVDSVELARQLILDGKYDDLKKMFAKRKLAVNTDMFGVLPIHLAAGASKNAKKTTHFFLKMGSNPNAKTKNGNLTPLHISVYRKNYDVVKLLITEGANPLLRDEDNRDSFAIARRLKDDYCLKLLRSFDVSNEMTEMSDNDGDEKSDDDECKSLVDQFETTLGNSVNKPKTADVLSVTSDDSFVTAVGGEVSVKPRINPIEQFIVRYPLEMQLVFSGRFTPQELQVLDAEFTAAFRAAAATSPTGPFGPARRTPLGMRYPSGRVFFNYFLFDPRMFPQLRPPLIGYDAERISLVSFLQALFYIGKGVKNRPTQHLEDAKAVLLGRNSKSPAVSPAGPALKATSPPSTLQCANGRIYGSKSSAKIERVLSVWASGRGVVALHAFNNQSETEAFTREACCIDAISLQNLTNLRRGDMTGPVCTTWPDWKRRKYGASLIVRAYNILRLEAPPELLPTDFK